MIHGLSCRCAEHRRFLSPNSLSCICVVKACAITIPFGRSWSLPSVDGQKMTTVKIQSTVRMNVDVRLMRNDQFVRLATALCGERNPRLSLLFTVHNDDVKSCLADFGRAQSLGSLMGKQLMKPKSSNAFIHASETPASPAPRFDTIHHSLPVFIFAKNVRSS